MKRTFTENVEGAKGNELTEDAILNAIPVDARDGLIDINEPDGSFGRYTWYIRFAPFSDEEAKIAADAIKDTTGRRTTYTTGRDVFVLIMDYPSRPTSESKKLVKEGAGAGYDVGISDLEIGEVTEVKQMEDGDYTFTAKIVPDTYEISAEDYYNDFFWQEHELGITPKAKIDGGEIHGTICPWEDTDDPEFWIQRQVEGSTFNLSFMYGGGWMHVDLPEDGQIYVDEHLDITPELYFSIDDIHLDAIDLVQAVNFGHASIFDRDEEEDEDGEQVNEVSGWKLEDEDLTLDKSERKRLRSELEAKFKKIGYWIGIRTDGAWVATPMDEGKDLVFKDIFEARNFIENNHPLAKGVDKKKFAESRRDVYTLDVNYLDEDGEPQTIEAMKYAKTYYSFEDALNAAKEAYLEYSEAFDESVEVYVMGGEYETDGGDIYGEPVLLEVVSADTIDSL